MNLRDNNNYNINNNNNNNTDTSNSLYEHIHLNINQYTQPIRFNIVRDNIHDTIVQNMSTISEKISEYPSDMGELDSNHFVTQSNVHNISSMPSTANNHSDKCTNEQPSIAVIPNSLDSVSLESNANWQFHTTNLAFLTSPDMSYTGTGADLQALDLSSPTSQVTTCNVNNISHSQDASNYPYMTLRDNNNYNINHNNNTDTSNSLFEHRHLNINQYTQPIRFNIVRDNIHDTIIQNMNTTSGNLRENHNGMEDLDSNNMDMCLNVNNISSTPNSANNHSEICINDQPSITVIPYSLDPVSLASNASRQFHTNLSVLTSPDMSYTGTGANLLERSSGTQVGPRMHPLESIACVTSAGKAQLTTLQSSDWEPRTEYRVQIEESMEQPALPMAVSGVHTLLKTEREAQLIIPPTKIFQNF
jgi:hypothetical protein